MLAPGGLIPTYRIHGIDLACDHDFGLPLPRSDRTPTVEFVVATQPPVAGGWDAARALATSISRADADEGFEFAATPGYDVIRVHGAADYYLWHDRIVCHLVAERHAALVPVHLLGMVLSLWLERHGVLTLHAAAVHTPAGVVALLAAKGGGKTSTCAALVAAGCGFVTDDLLALRPDAGGVTVEPAYPQMRMTPEQAAVLLPGAGPFEVVNPVTGKVGVPVGAGFGAFHADRAGLAVVYLPERVDPDAAAQIHDLSPRQAFTEVVRHTFLPREVADLGLQTTRFERLAALVSVVPFRRVRVPSGLDRLPAVARRIAADANRRRVPTGSAVE